MAPTNVTVTNRSDEPYSGYDHGLEAVGLGLPPAVFIEPGESADVTPVKAEQLKTDHPDWFGEGSSRSRGRGRSMPADGADDVEE